MSHFDDDLTSSQAYQENVALPDQRAFAAATEVEEPATEEETTLPSLFEARFLAERHYHHSQYSATDKLLRMCARCGKDLTDRLHFRVREDTA